jgi:hypothetical protein
MGNVSLETITIDHHRGADRRFRTLARRSQTCMIRAINGGIEETIAAATRQKLGGIELWKRMTKAVCWGKPGTLASG